MVKKALGLKEVDQLTPEQIKQILYEELPKVNPDTLGGVGRATIEVVGLATDGDVTIDELSKAMEDRALSSSTYEFMPVISNQEAIRGLEFLSIVENQLLDQHTEIADQDLSGLLLVVPVKNGQGGKLVYFLTRNRRGNPVVGEVNDYVSHDRLVAEKKMAILSQIEKEQPTRVRNIRLKVNPDDLRWPLLSVQITEYWLDRKISEKQHDKIQALLAKLKQVCEGQAKAYIAGRERTVDIKDFLTYVEETDEYFLDIAYANPNTGNEEVKLA